MYSQFFILDSWFSQKSKSQLFQGYSNYNCIQFVIQYVYQCMLSSLISFNFKTCFDSWAFESYNTICSEGNVKWICPKSKNGKMRCSDVNQVEITYLSKVINVVLPPTDIIHTICALWKTGNRFIKNWVKNLSCQGNLWKLDQRPPIII